MGTQFTINDEQIQTMIAQQIFANISEETRDRLISEALSFLMKEQDQYGRKIDSPLAQAFKEEVVKVGRDVVTQILGEDHIRKTVEKAIEDHVKAWVKSRDYDLPYVIGEAVRHNIDITMRSNN